MSAPTAEHPHEFTRIRTPAGAELLGSCRICGLTAADVLTRIVLERDARLGQVYDLLDAVTAILTRPRRSTCHTRPKTSRRKR